MKFTRTALPEVVLIEPDVHRDERGFFLESFQERRYGCHGIRGPFVQDNHSFSRYRTLRGLHAQVRLPQGKLVRAIDGEIFDVAVDIRPGSPRFGRWIGVTLSGSNFRQLYVPAGFAHGFCVLSQRVRVEYKCTEYYDPDAEITLMWNDPAVGVHWPIREPVLSRKDAQGLELADLYHGRPSMRDDERLAGHARP